MYCATWTVFSEWTGEEEWDKNAGTRLEEGVLKKEHAEQWSLYLPPWRWARDPKGLQLWGSQSKGPRAAHKERGPAASPFVAIYPSLLCCLGQQSHGLMMGTAAQWAACRTPPLFLWRQLGAGCRELLPSFANTSCCLSCEALGTS